MNHIYFWIVTLPGTSLVIKVNWNIPKYSSVWFHLIHSRMFLHLVQNPTGNSSDLNHPIHEFLWFFTENPLVTGHNYLKLYQITLINLVHRVYFIRKYCTTLIVRACICICSGQRRTTAIVMTWNATFVWNIKPQLTGEISLL